MGVRDTGLKTPIPSLVVTRASANTCPHSGQFCTVMVCNYPREHPRADALHTSVIAGTK